MPPSKKKTQATERPSLKEGTTPSLHNTRMAWVAVLLLCAICVSVFAAAQARIQSVNDVILHGVTIGGVDVSDMTRDEAVDAVSRVYNARINGNPVYVYASNEDMASEARNPEVSDTDSIEEVRQNTVAWATNASELDAQVDYFALADTALAAGRGGVFAQLGLESVEEDIPVVVNLNNQMVDALAQEIDYTLGDPYDNFGVAMEGGKAYVTPGHDGYMVDREWLSSKISEALLKEDTVERAFVADVQYHEVQIDEESAQYTADLINTSIADGLNLNCGEVSWTLSPSQLAHWVRTEEMADGKGGHKLQPYINGAQAKSALLVAANGGFAEGSAKMAFEKNNGKIFVNISGADELPMVGDAVDEMDNVLFGGRAEKPLPAIEEHDEVPHVEVHTAKVPKQMTLEDAVQYGIVTIVSEYTTEYTAGAEARNHNIHLAADLIDQSITPGGKVWSFNEVVGGECDAEKGFEAAAIIANNETVDAIGGGVCQVATTVFNAAYQAGYDIVERSNHTLFIPSYPAGRDATIAWPELDLKFRNETNSDILLDMSYTDTTVTATIYGIDPGYTVNTDTGEMLPGQKAKTRYEYDAELGPGEEYTKSYGVDGQQITVIRYVYDSSDALVREDTFHSEYSAVDTVIVQGDASMVDKVEEGSEEMTEGEEITEGEESSEEMSSSIEEEWVDTGEEYYEEEVYTEEEW